MNNEPRFYRRIVRRIMEDNKWYYCLQDVSYALTGTKDRKQYVKKLRKRDEELRENWEKYTTKFIINTKGGRQFMNCADKTGVIRFIEKISSKKKESFKRWLDRVDKEEE